MKKIVVFLPIIWFVFLFIFIWRFLWTCGMLGNYYIEQQEWKGAPTTWVWHNDMIVWSRYHHFDGVFDDSTFSIDRIAAEKEITIIKQKTRRPNQEDQWTMDSTTDYMVKMFECKHLEDSEKGIYIQYAQGEATYDQYQRAHDVYMKYFKEIYQPYYNRLSKHVK